MRIPVIDRLMARISLTESGCWEWQGYTNGSGYGTIGLDGHGAVARVHRVAYEYFIGPIPAGFDLDHLCRNRRCCNFDHLEAVTHLENMRRGWNATKTECPQGHPYAGTNLYVNPRGGRACRACLRASGASRRARKRASAFSPRKRVSVSRFTDAAEPEQHALPLETS